MDPMLAWGLGLLTLAIVLLVIEILVPSGGVIGIAAFLVSVVGVVALFRYDAAWGAAGSLMVVVAIPASIYAWVRIFPSTPIGRAMMGSENPEPDSIAKSAEPGIAQGTRATALTDLHPVGFIELDGKRLDARARGSLIDAGTEVVVVTSSGMQLEVEPAD